MLVKYFLLILCCCALQLITAQAIRTQLAKSRSHPPNCQVRQVLLSSCLVFENVCTSDVSFLSVISKETDITKLQFISKYLDYSKNQNNKSS